MRNDADCGHQIAVPEMKFAFHYYLFTNASGQMETTYVPCQCHSLHRGHRALPFETIIATQLYYSQLNCSKQNEN